MLCPKRGNKFMLFLIVFQAVITIILSLAVLAAMKYTNLSEITLNNFIAVTQDIYIFLIPIGIYLIFTKSRLRDVVPHSRLSLKNILYIMALTLLFAPVISVISSVTALFAPADINKEIIGIMDSLPMAVSLFAMAFMPAVCEELTFRGILLSNYKSAGIAKAAILTGFLFGLIHGNLYQIIYAVAAGTFFAVIVAYTNSIFASMLSHFLFNGVQVLISELVLSMGNINTVLNTAPTLQENMTAIVADLFLTVITLPFLVLVFRKFMDCNKNNILDYRYSIEQNKLSTLNISIDGSEPVHKIADVYLVISVIVSVVITAVSAYLS